MTSKTAMPQKVTTPTKVGVERTRPIILVAAVIIAVSAVQDPVAAWLSLHTSPTVAYAVVVAKYLGALLLLAAAWLGDPRQTKVLPPLILVGAAYVLLAMTYLLLPGAKHGSMLVASQSLVMPVVLTSAGFLITPSTRDIRTLLAFISVLAVVSVLLGTLDQLLLPASTIWTKYLDLGDFLTRVKGVPADWLIDGLPFNFFYSAGHLELRRLVGLSGSPLATGYSLLLPLLLWLTIAAGRGYGVAASRVRPRVFVLVIGVGVLLTLTRGAIVSGIGGGMAISVLARRSETVSTQRWARIAGGVAVALALAMALPPARAVVGSTINGTEGSAAGHIAGSRAGLADLRRVIVMGGGLGTAGGAGQLGRAEVSSGAGEDAYLVIAAQIGVPGMILFGAWLSTIAVALLRARRLHRGEIELYAIGSIGVLVAYSLSGFFSEQLLTFTTFSAGWIMLGAVSSFAYRRIDAADKQH